jgi:hypothetical protein
MAKAIETLKGFTKCISDESIEALFALKRAFPELQIKEANIKRYYGNMKYSISMLSVDLEGSWVYHGVTEQRFDYSVLIPNTREKYKGARMRVVNSYWNFTLVPIREMSNKDFYQLHKRVYSQIRMYCGM